MKYFAQRDLVIDGNEIKRGDVVADVTPAAGIPLERAVAAIANGHATASPPDGEAPAKAVRKPEPPAPPAAVPVDRVDRAK